MGRKTEGGGVKLENAFQEIRMEHRSSTAIHDCIAGDAVEPVFQEEEVKEEKMKKTTVSVCVCTCTRKVNTDAGVCTDM